MKVGDLVKWSKHWLTASATDDEFHPPEYYKSQTGMIVNEGTRGLCHVVLWNNGQQEQVHEMYLEVL